MVKTNIVLLTLLICLPAFAQQATPDWGHSYQEGLKLAGEQTKPILIDFYADWCGPCKAMDAQTFTDPRVIKAMKDFVAIKVDVDQDEKTAFAYKIRSIPRTVILNIHGEMVGDRVGFMDSDQYLAFLSDVAEYTHKKIDGIVINVPESATGEEAQTLLVNEDTPSSELMEFLAHKDPKVRKAAQDQLLTRDPAQIRTILDTALTSEYLGDRIAALEALTQQQQTKPKFDPWAPKNQREAARETSRANQQKR